MSNRLSGSFGLAYRGTNADQPPNWSFETRNPTQYDTQNFSVGDMWLNSISKDAFLLVSLAGTNTSKGMLAEWILLTGNSGTVTELTGNSGGAVAPDVGGNINVVGDGTTITIVGVPATNTLTASIIGGAPLQSLTTSDANIVTPTTGTIILANGNNITTTGTVGPNTVTISISGTTNHAVQLGNASGSLTSLGVGTNGQVLLGATAANPSWVTPTAGTGLSITTNATTLEYAAAVSVPLSFPTDSGTATPAANALTIKTDQTGLNSGSSVLFTGSGAIVTLSVTDASANTLIGNNGGNLTLSGSNNTGLGKTVLHALTTANANTVVGSLSGALITTGSNNTIFGENSGNAITTGTSNIIVGQAAGNAYVSSEKDNIVIGNNAGVVTEFGNIRIGNTTVSAGGPDNNTFIGNGTGISYTVGSLTGATAVGSQALNALTTGIANSAFGVNSLVACTSGASNMGFGNASLAMLTTGIQNTAVGRFAMGSIITGSYNVAIGYNAGNLNVTGAESSNIYINNPGVNNESNTIRIADGTGAGNTQVNKCFIAGIRGITTGVADAIAVLVDSANQLGTVSSSIRFKENVEDMADHSSALMNLRPVVFNYKDDVDKNRQTGLIAEEVLEEMPNLVVYGDDGLPLTIKYHELGPLLLNELQKLSNRVLELELKLSKCGKE